MTFSHPHKENHTAPIIHMNSITSSSKHPLTLALVLTAFAAIAPYSIAAAEREEHRELPAAAGGTLTFKTFVGAVEIKTHDKDQVIYDAVLKSGNGWLGGGSASPDDVAFLYQQADGDVKITVQWKDGKQPRNSHLNCRHVLLVPARYHLDVRTAGGGIVADDIGGNVAARTSGGSIRFGKVHGEIKAQTAGGSITAEDIRGNVEVSTSGGSIQAGNVDGDVSASTSGGSIKLGTVTGEVRGSTSGGSIRAELAGEIARPVELSTSGGSIKLAVPGDFKADLNASTSGGHVDCELPVQGTVKRNSVRGKVNGGGPNVTLHTSGGSIKVAKR